MEFHNNYYILRHQLIFATHCVYNFHLMDFETLTRNFLIETAMPVPNHKEAHLTFIRPHSMQTTYLQLRNTHERPPAWWSWPRLSVTILMQPKTISDKPTSYCPHFYTFFGITVHALKNTPTTTTRGICNAESWLFLRRWATVKYLSYCRFD